VDLIHIWAFPDSGGSPLFVGQAPYGGARPDVAGAIGAAFLQSGFSFFPARLPPGGYTLTVYARSTSTGAFTGRPVHVTINPSAPEMFVDTPAVTAPVPNPPGGIDPGTRLTSPFSVSGWAIDRAIWYGANNSGVDAVHVWALPVGSGLAPRFLGAAARMPRSDIMNRFGGQFENAGFVLSSVSLPAGTYDLVVHARSTIAGTFNNSRLIRITVQ
jgi:hypothetical protein